MDDLGANDTNHSSIVSHWYIGVFIAIAGCLIDAIGWMIEKKSHIQLQEKYALLNKSESVKYLCSGSWWCGFITHTIGSLIFAISLGLGKQSLITPLQSFTLLFNSLFAWKFLKEKLTKIQILGTVIIIVGCAFAIVFGPKYDNQIHTAYQLGTAFGQPVFLTFMTFIISVFLVNYIMYKFIQCGVFTDDHQQQTIDTETISDSETDINRAQSSFPTYSMFCEIGFAAFYGSWSALFTKCTVEIFGTSAIFGATNLTHWFTYACMIGIVAFAVLLEYWRQEALKHYPANNVSSIYNTLLIIFGISFGAAFFGEFNGMTWFKTILFILSVGVSIVGVLMLTLGDRGIMTVRLKYNKQMNKVEEELQEMKSLLQGQNEDNDDNEEDMNKNRSNIHV